MDRTPISSLPAKHNILDMDPSEDVKHIYVQEADSLKKVADALYETSKYMLYHNNN